MEQTLDWSTGSLPSDEALVLRVGALFPGGWRLDAAQRLTGEGVDVLRATSGLVDKSLVLLDSRSGRGVPRWVMLDVVREFVHGPAPHRVEPGQRTAFTGFYLDLLREVENNVGREQEWFEPLLAEEANLRTALQWAAEDGDAETLLRLAGGMWQFWQTRGELVEGRRWLEMGLARQPLVSDETRMTALWGSGWLAYHQADDTAAEAAAVELEELARRNEDERARRNAVTIRAMVAIAREDTTVSVTLLEEALRIARRLGRPWLVATSLLNLGLGRLSAADTAGARTMLSQALTAYEEIGDERFRARCLGYLGLASLVEDDPGRARSLFGQSLTVFRQFSEPGGTAEGLAGIAAIDASTGHLATAATLSGAAERLRESYAGRELPLDRRTNRRYLAPAESRLGPDAWAEAWAVGRDLPLAEAIDLALAART
jgi:non-specific serine/threonine protein kinase